MCIKDCITDLVTNFVYRKQEQKNKTFEQSWISSQDFLPEFVSLAMVSFLPHEPFESLEHKIEFYEVTKGQAYIKEK